MLISGLAAVRLLVSGRKRKPRDQLAPINIYDRLLNWSAIISSINSLEINDLI